MNIVVLVVVCTFVISVLLLVAFALYELSPFASHTDQYRDPATGKRRFDSPRLD